MTDVSPYFRMLQCVPASAKTSSLTKHGKALAFAQFGKRKKEKVDKKTKKRTVVLDKEGNPVMVRCDSSYFQGQALQDAFHQYLTNEMGLDWAVRGSKKIGRDPDRREVEEYKINQDRNRQDKKIEQENAMLERSADLAQNARKLQKERQDKQLEAKAAKRDELDSALQRKQRQLDELETQAAAARHLIEVAQKLRDEIEPLRTAVEALYDHRAAVAKREAAKAQERHIQMAVRALCEDGSPKDRFINAYSVVLSAPGEVGQLAVDCWRNAFPESAVPQDIRDVRQALHAMSGEDYFSLQDAVQAADELVEAVNLTRTALDMARTEIERGRPWVSIGRKIMEIGKAIADAIKICVESLATAFAREEAVSEDDLQLSDEARAFDKMPVETKQAIEEALHLKGTVALSLSFGA